MRSVIRLLTTNPRKVAEWRANFDRYGIAVEAVAPAADVAALLGSGDPEVRILAVCREQSDLYRRGTRERSDRRHLELVDNVTDLTVHYEGRSEAYTHVTPGFIDRSNGATEGEGGWWDTIFRLESTLLTYDEMRRRGFKHSSRDMAISRFILDRVHYKARVDLKWNPQGQGRTIEFDDSVARFVAGNELLQNEWARRSGLTGAFQAVVEGGVFFRAAKNRREKIYWWPGLNAGIPFVPKKDEIHEITYMVHDFCHFLIPDPIFTGQVAEWTKKTYVTCRMLSEAITLVLADMLFVDSLKRSGHDYDWTKRRIYPLYEALGFGGGIEDLKDLLRANVAYCLRGDDSLYRARLRGATAALEAFEDKYMPFFVEDYRWTDRNFDDMSRRAPEFERWWRIVSPLRDGLGLETIEEVGPGTVESHFERIFERRVRPALTGRVEPGPRRGRAFLRYMMGQLGIFARFDFVAESPVFRDGILSVLLERGTAIDPDEIARVRAFYERYVEVLAAKNLMTLDDAATYKEVFPLFEPFYVSYDGPKESYEDLKSVARRILG